MSTSPFQYRDYRAFWLARLSSTIANTMLVVVIGIHVYDIARETMSIREASFWLGMVGLAQFLPLFLLVLIAGYIADRVDRRMIARLCIAAEMVSAAALALLRVRTVWPVGFATKARMTGQLEASLNSADHGHP